MISVIVPVYNTEKYLDRCIQSVLSQTYTDFELLLIDDGSTDSSGAICDKYAEQDSRVRVFHKENGGVTSARRLGVENARGIYVTFVDSDDEMYSNALFVFAENIGDEHFDIVCTELSCEAIITGDQYVKNILKGINRNMLWGNLYRRALFTEEVMDIPKIINVGEDTLMNIKLGLNESCSKVKNIPNVVYYYRQHNQSAIHTRKFNLEYEELYIEQLTKILGNRLDDFTTEYYFSNLRTLENIILHRVPVDYNRRWICELRIWYKNRRINFRTWVVLNIKNNFICKYILALETRVKYLLKCLAFPL